MTTAKSSSEKSHSYFTTAFRRQLAFAIVTTIVLFIAIVVPYLVGGPNHMYYVREYGNSQLVTQYYADQFDGIYLSEGQGGFVGVFLAFVSFASALTACRYMHSKKMTDLFHALPMRREKMLLVNLGSSMLSILGPFTAIYLLTMVGQLAAYGKYGWVGTAYWRYLTMDYLSIVVLVWVIYTLTVFVAVNVGTTFDALATSGTFMFLPPAVYMICGAVWEATYYGAVFRYSYALRISPFLFFFERFHQYNYGLNRYNYPSIAAVFSLWFLLGCALMAAAVFCYRRRKSEDAEQTQPRGVFQMIVKVFVGFFGAFVFLMIFLERSLPSRMLAILFGAVAIGLIAELILSRGVGSMVRNLKWLAGAGLVFSLLYMGLSLDLFGFEGRIPALDTVAAVEIDYHGRFENDLDLAYYYETGFDKTNTTLTDTAAIEIVQQAHRALLENHLAEDPNQEGYHSLSLRYRLKNGGEVVRGYYGIDGASYRILAGLEGQEEFIRENSTLFSLEAYDAYPDTNLTVSVGVSSAVNARMQALSLDDQQLYQLIRALQNDMLRQSLGEVLNPAEPVQGYIRLGYSDSSREWGYITTAYATYPPEVLNAAIAEERVMMATLDDGIAVTSGSMGELWVPVTRSCAETLELLEDLNAIAYLEPNLAEVREIRVTELYNAYYYNNYNTVKNIMPNGFSEFGWQVTGRDGYGLKIFSVADPEEIAALSQKGYAAMMVNADIAQQVMAMVFCDENGDAMATQYVRVADLPESIRGEAAKYLEDRYAGYYIGAEAYNTYEVESFAAFAE